MRRLLLAVLACALLTTYAHAAVETFRTSQSSDSMFSQAVGVLLQEGFVLRFTDKAQGTIQADKMAWGSGTPALSVFVRIGQDGEQTKAIATFTKSPGVIGRSANKYAVKFGKDLKNEIPDLASEIKKK